MVAYQQPNSCLPIHLFFLLTNAQEEQGDNSHQPNYIALMYWCSINLSSCNATSESNRNLLWYETHVPIMLMTWIIYYSPHIFSLRSKDQLIRFYVSYPTFLQVLFFRRFHYTALWLSIPLNTRINTDSSTAFIVIIYLQLMDVRAYHLSCVGDTINGSH